VLHNKPLGCGASEVYVRRTISLPFEARFMQVLLSRPAVFIRCERTSGTRFLSGWVTDGEKSEPLP